MPPTFSWTLRVYYEDTDSGGVVYYANYLKFLERARTEWLRTAGFEQTELVRDHNVIFMVRSVAIEYLLPACFNDILKVTVQLEKIGSCTLDVFQTVERDTRLIKARVQIVCIDNRDGFKPDRKLGVSENDPICSNAHW